MDHDALVSSVVDTFRDYGYTAEVTAGRGGQDRRLTLERDGVTRAFDLELAIPLTVNATTLHGDPRRVYITDYLSARSAEVLRRMGVHFVDAAGNAFVREDGWFIDVRGRRSAKRVADPRRFGASTNLYSAKRAQVIFALLTWPELLDASVRTVADAAGVSVGIAQSTMSELRRRTLWPDRGDARSALIDGWAAAFPETLARSLTIRTVRAERFDGFSGRVLASGEAAASAQMRATSGVVYVDDLTTELLIENRWRTDGPANLVVRRRFWSHGDSAPHEAPALLVYGDLLATDDPRTRSVAREYRGTL